MLPSKKFLIALRLDPEPAYRIAQRAGVNPSTLSRLINGIDRIKPEDPRIAKVGLVLGLSPEECFEAQHSPANFADVVVAVPEGRIPPEVD